jgi:type IV pilus assembly protein PilO
MATSSAMADFAKMPTEKKVLVFAVIGLLLGALYWKTVYSSLNERLETAQADHDTKVSTNKRLAEDIPKYEELRTHMTKLRELIEKNQTALPTEAEVPAFFQTLQQKVNESGVEINKWANRAEEPVESFVKVPVDVEMTGTFMQIKRFFASLIQRDVRPSHSDDKPMGGDEHERIVSIENLALTNPTVRNREIVLNAKFTAVTFRQEDKAAPPPGANGQPAPRPTARPPAVPPPSSAPPPPLPSATTPAGAKARVENSIDKGDTRNRNAAGVNEAKAGSDRLKGGI